jgi:hypothetical protein
MRNFERAGVPRSVAMKPTGHKTEAVYQRYAIVCEVDLADGLKKLAAPRCRFRMRNHPALPPPVQSADQSDHELNPLLKILPNIYLK